MAVSSFPRPDPSSPASVAQASFGSARKGFDPEEVRAFLGQVAAEMGRLRDREQQLEQTLLEAKDQRGSGERIDETTATRLLGEAAAHILQAARESAAMVKAKAEEGAAAILGEATEEAGRVREAADVEAARRRSDSAADAEAQISMAKQQGREMVNEARLYRERVLGELTRRRDLVRSQVDDLIRGREQLLTAFNAARDAADDVLSRIGPLGDAGMPYELPEPPAMPEGDFETGAPAFGAQADSVAGEHEGIGVGELDPPRALFDQDDEVAEVADDTVGNSGGSVVELFPAGEAPAHDGPEQTATVDSLFAKLRAAKDDDVSGTADAAEEADVAGIATAATADTTEMAVTGVDADEEGGEQSPFQRRDAQLAQLIVAAARRVKRVLADEQNEALDALRQGEPVNTVEGLLRDETQRVSRYVDAMANELEAAATAGAMSVNDDPNPEVAHSGALGPVRESFAANIVAPLRERLERAVAEGDGDNDVVAKRVRAVYREWKTQQVDNQLDDVFRLAYGRGVLVALPAGTPVRWIVDPAGPPCPDAEDNSLAGSVPSGEAFPTGHVCAPAHADCRCLLAPDQQ